MLLDGQTINNFVDTLPLGRIIKRKMNPSSGTLQYPAMDGVVILSNRGGRCKSHLIPHFLSSASLIGFSHLFILPSWPWFYFIACKWTCQLYYTYHGLAGMSCVTLAWGARHPHRPSPALQHQEPLEQKPHMKFSPCQVKFPTYHSHSSIYQLGVKSWNNFIPRPSTRLSLLGVWASLSGLPWQAWPRRGT